VIWMGGNTGRVGVGVSIGVGVGVGVGFDIGVGIRVVGVRSVADTRFTARRKEQDGQGAHEYLQPDHSTCFV